MNCFMEENQSGQLEQFLLLNFNSIIFAMTSHYIMFNLSLANARPNLVENWVWEPHAQFLVFEAWFQNARRSLLGAKNVYQICLYVAHSQSFRLYQMTYVERQKLDKEDDG